MSTKATFEIPLTEEVNIDGYKIDLSGGALGGQALIYNAGANSFIAATLNDGYGTLSGSFVPGQVAFGTDTFLIDGSNNFTFDGYNISVYGDGYFTKRLILNGDTAAVSASGTGAFRFNSGTNHLEFSENGGSWAQIGVGTVTSVSNSDSTLTVSPTTGAVVASLNLGHANTWSAKQTFSSHIAVDGYTFDLSAGATTNQVLTFNGTSFVASNATGGISGTLTNTKVPYATGSSTIADSGMAWDNTNKILTITTLAGNDGVAVTDGTRSLGLFVNYNTAAVGALGTTSNHNLVFFTNSQSAQMTLDTNGNLGIGISPSYKLDVNGDVHISANRLIIDASSAAVSPSGTGAIRFNTATNHLEFSENAGGWTQFGSGGGGGMSIGGAVTSGTAHSVLYVDGSGNLAQDNSNLYYDYTNHRLGITNTSPSYKLDIAGAASAGFQDIQLRVKGGTASGGGMIVDTTGANNQATVYFYDQGILKWQIGKQTDSSFFLYDATHTRNAIAVDTSGNITTLGSFGIGAAPSTSYALDVTGTASNGAERIQIANTANFAEGLGVYSASMPTTQYIINRMGVSAATGNAAETAFYYAGNNNANNAYAISFFATGIVGYFTKAGDVGIGGASISGGGSTTANAVLRIASNTSTVTTINSTGLALNGSTFASYLLDVRKNVDTSIVHVAGSGNDDGLFMNSNATGASFAAGAARSAGTWVAKATSAELLDLQSSGLAWFMNTGLTIGNTFTPTLVFQATSTTIQNNSGAWNHNGIGGINLQRNGTTMMDVGVTSSSQVTISSSQSGSTMLTLKNTNTAGYSAIDLQDSGGTSHGTMGYGNGSVGLTNAQGRIYINRVSTDFAILDSGNFNFLLGANGNIAIGASSVNTNYKVEITGTYPLSLSQSVSSSGSPSIHQFTGAAHTTLASATEAIDGYYKLDRTVQFTGSATPGAANITTQRAVYISAPTYAFSSTGAQTIATAATLAIGAAPSVGANATITNAYALLVQSGTTGCGGNVIPTTSNSYSLGSSSLKWKDGYFAGKLQIDGYNIDLSSGMTSGQVLGYNGTSIVATSTPSEFSYTLRNYYDNLATGKAAGSANEVHGSMFYLTTAFTITGAQFYWGDTQSKTIRVRLYTTDGTSQANVDVAVNGAGWYTATFSSPYSASAYTPYVVSHWETGGTLSWKFNMRGSVGSTPANNLDPYGWGGSNSSTPATWQAGAHFWWMSWALWSTGDVIPGSSAGSERYAIEPIFTVP